MKINMRVMVGTAATLATIGAIAFAITAPGAQELLTTAGSEAQREGAAGGEAQREGAAGEGAARGEQGAGEEAQREGAIPSSAAAPEILAARFAVQPGAPRASRVTPPAPLPTGEREEQVEASAPWMRYVGRVGGSENGTIFYYKNERTDSVVRVGESPSAEWQIVSRTPESLIIRNDRDEVLSVEAPE